MDPNQDQTASNSNNQYLTREEAMRFLRVSRTTFAKVVRRHAIPVYRLTRRPLFNQVDLVAVLESNKTNHKNKTTMPAS